ncbi:MAG: toll/interleukin-1 receptor domain-containing protein [Terricaulis sp.]
MTVFIAFAEADRDSAEALERALERRGHFVEPDNGETALRPVAPADVVITLISENFAAGAGRLRLEQRALDAWTEGGLVLVKLDDTPAPVGLRDLPSIDARSEEKRDAAWISVADAIKKTLAPRPQARSEMGGETVRERVDNARRKEARGGPVRVLLAILLMIPGLVAIAAAVSIWLVNRIGPTPGTFADLLAGIDAFGVRYGVPAGVTPYLFAAAIALTIAAPAYLFVRQAVRRRQHEALAREHPEIDEDYESPPIPARAAAPPSDTVFVSYARANAATVMPVLAEARTHGNKFWLDQDGIDPGDGWAGEIVRAIKGAKGVMVMCSSAAFESDHVKREVYLADRYKKRLLPIFIEDAEPPEDFEYFFAGVQFLKLHETPEQERPAAVQRILEI